MANKSSDVNLEFEGVESQTKWKIQLFLKCTTVALKTDNCIY